MWKVEQNEIYNNVISIRPHILSKGEKTKKTFACLLRLNEWMGSLKLFIWKGLSVYYKRRKEKCTKKQKKKISSSSTLKVSISRFPHFFYMAKLFDLLLFMKRQQSIKLWRVWRFLACWIHFSSYHPFSILFTPFFFLSFSISSSFRTPSHLFFVFMGYLDSFAQW